MDQREKIKIIMKILSSRITARMNPISLEFVITYRCNLNCTYCDPVVFNGGENAAFEEEMSAEQIDKIFSKLDSLGVARVNISGGEPLMRKDISKILESAFTKRFYLTLTTNGILVPTYIELLTSLNSLIISIDGRKETHDYLRGDGSHKAALKALDISRKKGINVILSSIITQKTSDDDLLYLLKLCDFFDSVCVLQPLTEGAYVHNKWKRFKETKEIKPSLRHLESLFRNLKNDHRKKRILGGNYYFEEILKMYRRRQKNINKPSRCMAGKLFLCITPSGKILPCSMRYEHIFGKNIQECTVEEIKMTGINSIQCAGCSCYSYMLLNGLAAMDMKTITHCLMYDSKNLAKRQ